MRLTSKISRMDVALLLGCTLQAAPLLAQTAAEPAEVPVSQPVVEAPLIGAEVRAQLSALQRTIISAELNARIDELPWREGQSVKAGQLLVRFDCRTYQAQLEQAQAQRKEAAATVDVQRRLSSLQATSELEQQQAEARLEQAQAEVSLRKVLVDRCEIVAPFAGRIGVIARQAHEVVAPGDRLVELVNDRDLEVEMIVPSAGLKALRKGTRFSVQLDEMSKPMKAEVDRTGGLIDPVSQSVRIFGRLINPPAGLLPGMSGLARFEAQ